MTRHLFLNSFLTIGIVLAALPGVVCAQPVNEPKESPMNSRAQQLMGDTAPKLAELTDDVLYKDIWERPGLSKRDRSLVTISALIALNRPDQLKSHIRLGLQNGLTKDEIVETITHMAFYSGWPSAVSSVAIAKEVFAE
ncbi:cytochrome D ubiquinol oxidase subunit II [Rhizobium leguminosarum bv. trifolii]|uniref:Cytochrome D ubiquinol oxidase subunit II n=1 Tax=Rhizobium leguminosarum bv. trifolii TaxID=386 RepID=A0A3E1BT75_RHILT|nr:carboxymuconolactone decarboxylase family protein [Rhizobium leguminosarum]RFB96557.1 cytochrome D ubiquinol oxidase subunit II [Rhizobium leguminosarum bv. trifolii]RFB96680.1 cytochrome D ubiquinol oxidase subunit II [Rhizobium leguminosarum bv. trifolii]